MKRNHAVKTLSLPHAVLSKGMERADRFGLKFSHYVGMLIERDYESGGDTMWIHAKPKDQELGHE